MLRRMRSARQTVAIHATAVATAAEIRVPVSVRAHLAMYATGRRLAAGAAAVAGATE